MPVGPGDREVARACDVIDSVVGYEPAIDAIVVVDDAPSERSLAAELGARSDRLVVIPNAREGRGDGLWGGLAAGLLHAYGWLHREVQPDVVLKLDTDALVIAPYAARVAALFGDPDVGMVGTCRRHCDGRPRALDRWDFRVRRRRFLVRPWRKDGVKESRLELRHTLTGPQAVVRSRIAKARRTGYRYGVHCLGGAYAMAGRVLERMAEDDAFGEWPAWVDLDIGEDVCTSIYVSSVGYELRDANQRGDVFGVEYDELPLPPDELLDAGYAIVHTVKDQPAIDEASIRAFFAERRAAERARDATAD